MNLQDILLMYDYHYWANQLLLSKAALVTSEQFLAPSSHSFSSLRNTLVHTLDAEWSWRLTMQGEAWPKELSPDDFPTIESIQKRWGEEEQAMRQHLASLRDEDMTGIVRYNTDTGAVRERVRWHCLFHIVNHGMQHRSEIANLLTIYGQSPGDIDFTVFLNQRK